LAIRMVVVVGLMAIIVAIARPKWPNRIGIAHSVVAGILVHGFYLGGTAIAIAHSIPAGLSALIPGLQPILTSTLAHRWLGERVTPLQWAVLLLAWLAVVLSVGSIGLLYWLIRRSAATSVASLFYLEPAVTAVMAYALFGERLDAVAIAGMAACAAAVFLVNRRA